MLPSLLECQHPISNRRAPVPARYAHSDTTFTSKGRAYYPTMYVSMRGAAAPGSTGRRWTAWVMGLSAGHSVPWWAYPRIGWPGTMPITGSSSRRYRRFTSK
jgi:hypothetical protein